MHEGMQQQQQRDSCVYPICYRIVVLHQEKCKKNSLTQRRGSLFCYSFTTTTLYKLSSLYYNNNNCLTGHHAECQSHAVVEIEVGDVGLPLNM